MKKCLLILFVAFCSLGASNNAFAQNSGTCGTSLVWILSGEGADKTLTITGSGAMNDYIDYEYGYDVPWRSQRGNIKTLVINSGVTSIGNCAFHSCGFTSVTIPSTVTSIGSYAFFGCYGLTSIKVFATIPPTLSNGSFSSISSNALCYVPCSSLEYYKVVYGWSDLTYGDCISTAIDEINQSAISVIAISGGISITTPYPAEVSVFELSGRQVYQAKIAVSKEISLPQGVYVVKIGGESRKIVVGK